MLSVNTLKHSVIVNRSLYAAIFVFSLYCSVIILLLFVFNISGLTFPLFFLLLAIAVYGAIKVYRQRYYLKLSDSGRIEVISFAEQIVISGIVSRSSFYNGLFLSLHVRNNPNIFSYHKDNKAFSVVIYRDAVSESEYRLLARVINFGRN